MICTPSLQISARAIVIPLVLLVVLQGCLSKNTEWRHPSIAPADWSIDAAQCKWEARQKADRDHRDRATRTQQIQYKNTRSINAMFAISDVDNAAILLFSRCMGDLGYVEVIE